MKKKQERLESLRSKNLTEASLRILWWFFTHPDKEFSFNDICEQTKTAKTTARTVIDDFEKRNLISKTMIGRLSRLRANTTSPAFKYAKIAYNFETICGTNLIDFILKNYPQARVIVLFGSYRKGDDTSESDVDIAVEIPGTPELRVETLGTIDKLGFRENVKVNTHIFSREKIDTNVFANIANGIVLYGFLEARP
jgi:predicted nucleotidyltransferase